MIESRPSKITREARIERRKKAEAISSSPAFEKFNFEETLAGHAIRLAQNLTPQADIDKICRDLSNTYWSKEDPVERACIREQLHGIERDTKMNLTPPLNNDENRHIEMDVILDSESPIEIH